MFTITYLIFHISFHHETDQMLNKEINSEKYDYNTDVLKRLSYLNTLTKAEKMADILKTRFSNQFSFSCNYCISI